MTALKDKLREDLTTAMKARDELTTATLRMALTAVGNEEVSGKTARVLTDDEVITVLAKESKKRRESAEAFRAGDREDRAVRELAEQAVLEAYLPAQLTDDELTALAVAAVAESGASGPQGLGAAMKVLSPKVKGMADGSRVAAAVRAALGL